MMDDLLGKFIFDEKKTYLRWEFGIVLNEEKHRSCAQNELSELTCNTREVKNKEQEHKTVHDLAR